MYYYTLLRFVILVNILYLRVNFIRSISTHFFHKHSTPSIISYYFLKKIRYYCSIFSLFFKYYYRILFSLLDYFPKCSVPSFRSLLRNRKRRFYSFRFIKKLRFLIRRSKRKQYTSLNVFLKKKKISTFYNRCLCRNRNLSARTNTSIDIRGFFSKFKSYHWSTSYFRGYVSFLYKQKPFLSYTRYFRKQKALSSVLKKYSTSTSNFSFHTHHFILISKFLLNNPLPFYSDFQSHAFVFFFPDTKSLVSIKHKLLLRKQGLYLDDMQSPSAFFNLFRSSSHVYWN